MHICKCIPLSLLVVHDQAVVQAKQCQAFTARDGLVDSAAGQCCTIDSTAWTLLHRCIFKAHQKKPFAWHAKEDVIPAD